MRVLIQHSETRRFVARQGEWTNHAADAKDFYTLPNACAKSATNEKLRAVVLFPGGNGLPESIVGGTQLAVCSTRGQESFV